MHFHSNETTTSATDATVLVCPRSGRVLSRTVVVSRRVLGDGGNVCTPYTRGKLGPYPLRKIDTPGPLFLTEEVLLFTVKQGVTNISEQK